MRVCLQRILANRFVQSLCGFGEFFKLVVNAAQRSPAIAIFRTQFERDAEFPLRIGITAVLQIEDAEQVRRFRR